MSQENQNTSDILPWDKYFYRTWMQDIARRSQSAVATCVPDRPKDRRKANK